MPINIYTLDDSRSKIAWLCDDEWHLGPQISFLSDWLPKNETLFNSNEYVADIGFHWRRDALGGGGVLSPEIMKIMSERRFLCFYPSIRVFLMKTKIQSNKALQPTPSRHAFMI